jgi:ubiquinone/menaquinone biosynthesis C-methylase UbiE
MALKSYKFLKNYMADRCHGKKILDYGCGNGTHSLWLAEAGAEVVAIDLSLKSLDIARKRAEKARVQDKIKFIEMDCEKLDFPDNYFDIVFDGGTFSSLDLDKSLPELARVLKPEGFVIGIETLGHNPLTNLKRKINVKTGKRTAWAANHIFKTPDLQKAGRYFGKIETYFFHPISWIIFPFLKKPYGNVLLKFFEKIDEIILALPFLRKYSFKIVFVFTK